jgi:hypothetical protein
VEPVAHPANQPVSLCPRKNSGQRRGRLVPIRQAQRAVITQPRPAAWEIVFRKGQRPEGPRYRAREFQSLVPTAIQIPARGFVPIAPRCGVAVSFRSERPNGPFNLNPGRRPAKRNPKKRSPPVGDKVTSLTSRILDRSPFPSSPKSRHEAPSWIDAPLSCFARFQFIHLLNLFGRLFGGPTKPCS